MIEYRVGNLISAAKSGDVGFIAHCCNCLCNMGSGIAPQIKYAFPYAYEADLATQKGDYKKLGTLSIGDPEKYKNDQGEFNPVVFNLYGQFGYNKRKTGGRDLDYNALHDALMKMADELHRYDMAEESQHIVGLPMLGAGLANGNWNIISCLIEETLVKSGHKVIVYKLK